MGSFSPGDFARFVVAGWRLPAALAVVAMVLMSAYMLVASPVYEASITLAEKPSASPRLDMSALGQLGGSNLLGGIASSLGSPSSAKFSEFKGMITSRNTAQQLWARDDLLPRVFHNRYDQANHRWKKPGVLGRMRRWFNAQLGIVYGDKPNVDDTQAYLLRAILVSEDRQSQLAVVTARTDDKQLSQELVSFVVQAADGALRKSSLDSSEQYIGYIEDQLNNVTQTSHRQALIKLLDEQEGTAMMSRVAVPFATEVLTAPLAGSLPTFPRPTPLLLAACVVGMLAGIGYLFALFQLGKPIPRFWRRTARSASGAEMANTPFN